MDSFERIIRVSPKGKNKILWDSRGTNQWIKASSNPETDMPLPYYQTYGQIPEYYMEDQENERDMERLKEMYPQIAKKIAGYVEEECDKMEYEGSMMFDESPDRLMMRRIAKMIYDKMKEEYPVEEGEDKEENLVMNQEIQRRYPPGKNWLGDLVEVMLYQEVYRRRCRRRRCRRWY